MPTVKQRLASCCRTGLAEGLRTSLWLLKFMIPVSLAVTLLSWTGALQWAARWLRPAFVLLGLPPESVVAFLSAALLNIYSGIAAMGAIAMTDRQVTILAMMMLTLHNFPVEGVVQQKVGTPMWRMLLLRLTASAVAALALNWVLPAGDGAARLRGQTAAAEAFWPMLGGWAAATAILAGKVIAIVISLMVLQRALREFGLIDKLARLLWPLLWLLGLPHRVAFLWIVANTLGLAYGAAVMIDEKQRGAISPADAQLLNRSVGICHSLLEDTLLFVAVGAWAFWITVPRLVLAAAVVWAYRLAISVWPGSMASGIADGYERQP